jgi:TIR domain
MAKIFISYRRDDAADSAERIYDRLVAAFGKDDVFMDVDAIPIGVRFPDYLQDVVQQIDLLLVVIGKQWLDITTPTGQRRLDDPTDFVRLEIEAGLQRGIPLIPVLVQGALVPPASDLPESLRTLVDHQAISVRRNPDFDRDVSHLLEAIKAILATRAAFVEAQARRQAQEAERTRRAADAEEQLRRRAERAQARAKLTRSVSRLFTKPVGQLILLATVLLVVALVVVSPLGKSIAFLRQLSSSPTQTTGAAAPTVDTAATQTAAIDPVSTARAAGTATVTAFFTQPYIASLPGPCDHGGIGWRLYQNSAQFLGTLSCTADSMKAVGNASATFAGFANDTYPLHYHVSVDVTPSGTAGCPGLGGQYGAQHYQYWVSACTNGQWWTQEDNGTIRHAGPLSPAASYALRFQVQSGFITFFVAGIQVDKIQLTTDMTQTDEIFIGQGPSNGGGYFKNFVFTPLP